MPSNQLAIIGMVGLGVGLGLLGGVIGTFVTLKNTNGPRERAFVLLCAGLLMAGILAFLALQRAVPGPWKALLWPVYILALVFGVRNWNTGQARIRREEARRQG